MPIPASLHMLEKQHAMSQIRLRPNFGRMLWQRQNPFLAQQLPRLPKSPKKWNRGLPRRSTRRAGSADLSVSLLKLNIRKKGAHIIMNIEVVGGLTFSRLGLKVQGFGSSGFRFLVV